MEEEKEKEKNYMIEDEKFKSQLSFGPKCSIILTHHLTTQKARNTSLLSRDPTCIPSFISKVGN